VKYVVMVTVTKTETFFVPDAENADDAIAQVVADADNELERGVPIFRKATFEVEPERNR
jgi:hypothetical protein